MTISSFYHRRSSFIHSFFWGAGDSNKIVLCDFFSRICRVGRKSFLGTVHFGKGMDSMAFGVGNIGIYI